MNAIVPTLPPSRKVRAARAIDWCTGAWALFMRAPVPWIGLSLAMIALWLVFQFIPLLGQIALTMTLPLFIGDFQLAARKLEAGGTPDLGDFFAAFRTRATPLIVLGILMLVCGLVIAVLAGLIGMGAAFGLYAGSENGPDMAPALGAGLAWVFIALIVSMLTGMGFWFAPALVLFHDAAPLAAIRASFAASVRNLPTFLLLGLLYLLAAIAASIPFGLGWVVLVPLVFLVSYTSYRDVFEP